MSGTRSVVASVAAGFLLPACGAVTPSADARLCAEVERVAEEIAGLPPLEDDSSSETAHEHRVRASHLVVAATGDRHGTPSPELAAVVRAAGLAGAGRDVGRLGEGLADAYDACEDAGRRMDRDPLEAFTGP
jgi:hypothetical protein